MQKTFDEWFEEEGSGLFEEVLDWLRDAPSEVETDTLHGMTDEEYSMSMCQRAYGNG